MEDKTNRKSLIINISVFIITISILLSTFFMLNKFIKKSVYEEQKAYLEKQITTTSKLVDTILLQYNDYCKLCAQVISMDLEENDDIIEFIRNEYDKLYFEGTRFILVDNKGTWYNLSGDYGKISGMSYYQSDTPDNLCYITRGVDSNNNSFVFRNRLEKGIKVNTPNGISIIEYCSVIRDINDVENEVSDAFPYDSNRFITDENGLMLFKNFRLGSLINGTNIFTKYKNVDFMYNEDGNELVNKILNSEIVVGEFKINENNYFICTAPLSYNNWSISYVLPTSALSNGKYIKTIAIYISVFSFVLLTSILFIIAISTVMRKNQTKLKLEKETNLHLEKASKAKSTFLSNMSHDIRTPINGIIGMTYLAQKENNSDKTTECLSNIDKAAHHLLSLVNDVLDMSSIENEKVTITTSPIDLYNLVDNSINILSGQLQGRSLEVIKEYDIKGNRIFMIDELHFNQILLNIISNAYKYTLDGGKVYIRLKELDRKENKANIRIEIEDTGIGMKKEFLEHIFDQFAQENGGSRTQYKGTGLGMSIAKKYIELMNGTIKVESEYEKGSKFIIDIPFEISNESIINTKVDEIESTDINGIKILVAEDNEINQMIINEILSSNGINVVQVDNGLKALNTFESSKINEFDIVILDILMPEMNGFEAAINIRNLDRLDANEVPIIALTANILEDNIKTLDETGINEYLSKPVDPKVIINTIKKYIKIRSKK